MASSRSWLFRVGAQTAAHHATADAHRCAMMDCGSLAQYRAVLERIYGFEAAVERAASRMSELGTAVSGARTRTHRLYRDLAAVGLSDLDIATLPQQPIEVHDASAALGWLFVIERHVLLAGLLRRHLASVLPAAASAYLATYVDGGSHFRAFGDSVDDAIARGCAHPEAIVAAARRAFEAQALWYARVARRTRRASSQPPVHRPRTAA